MDSNLNLRGINELLDGWLSSPHGLIRTMDRVLHTRLTVSLPVAVIRDGMHNMSYFMKSPWLVTCPPGHAAPRGLWSNMLQFVDANDGCQHVSYTCGMTRHRRLDSWHVAKHTNLIILNFSWLEACERHFRQVNSFSLWLVFQFSFSY